MAGAPPGRGVRGAVPTALCHIHSSSTVYIYKERDKIKLFDPQNKIAICIAVSIDHSAQAYTP